MTTETQVQNAESPQRAMLAIAAALDRIEGQLRLQQDIKLDPWSGQWSLEDQPPLQANYGSLGQRGVKVTGDESSTEVELPPVTPERMERRRQFERQSLKLGEYLGIDEDWTEAYAHGGPMWLYLGNRDLVMSLPDHVRRALVEDAIEDSTQDAEEMARDILKQAGETGPGGGAMRIDEEVAPAR